MYIDTSCMSSDVWNSTGVLVMHDSRKTSIYVWLNGMNSTTSDRVTEVSEPQNTCGRGFNGSWNSCPGMWPSWQEPPQSSSKVKANSRFFNIPGFLFFHLHLQHISWSCLNFLPRYCCSVFSHMNPMWTQYRTNNLLKWTRQQTQLEMAQNITGRQTWR